MRPSDDDSVLSGDDSDGWEVEENNVVYLFAEQTRKEDALDNAALVDCPPVACVEEWLELAGENMNDVAAAAAGGDGPHYERVKVSFSLSTLKS